MKKIILSVLIYSSLCLTPFNILWASSEVALKEVEFDRSPERIKRGARAAMDFCIVCHNLKYIKYLNLLELDFTQAEVDYMRAKNDFDGPVKSTTGPDIAKVLYGMVPPDLSLIAKAREGGPAYVYSLLTGYKEDEQEKIHNTVFPGIKMPDPLAYSVELDKTLLQALDQKAQDIAVFLEWASDPRAHERRTMGYFVLVYLVILTILLRLVKVKVWRRLD